MGEIRIDIAFDYVDPGSYLVHRLLARWAEARVDPVHVRWMPLELRSPAAGPVDPTEPAWVALTDAMEQVARDEGIAFRRPTRIPGTRKAHELALHAREKGCFDEVHAALFEAHFVQGRDIGRVDVLAELGGEHGLPAAETRTVLGVDRFAPDVEEERREALDGGARGVPTLEVDGRRIEGFRGRRELIAFLDGNDRPDAGDGEE